MLLPKILIHREPTLDHEISNYFTKEPLFLKQHTLSEFYLAVPKLLQMPDNFSGDTESSEMVTLSKPKAMDSAYDEIPSTTLATRLMINHLLSPVKFQMQQEGVSVL